MMTCYRNLEVHRLPFVYPRIWSLSVAYYSNSGTHVRAFVAGRGWVTLQRGFLRWLVYWAVRLFGQRQFDTRGKVYLVREWDREHGRYRLMPRPNGRQS